MGWSLFDSLQVANGEVLLDCLSGVAAAGVLEIITRDQSSNRREGQVAAYAFYLKPEEDEYGVNTKFRWNYCMTVPIYTVIFAILSCMDCIF